jgi:DNA recombination protein RmuC
MRVLEGERKQLGGQLAQQLTALNDQTRSLSEALRRPGVRGQWGELTLRNVVEAAGMSEHCDFSSQEHLADVDGTIRPDMVVRLPGRGRLAVDAKVPLDSYLDALELEDAEAHERLLAAHAGSVRRKVKQLADKGYARRVGRSPGMVVMFVASEAAFSAAALADPKLLEDGSAPAHRDRHPGDHGRPAAGGRPGLARGDPFGARRAGARARRRALPTHRQVRRPPEQQRQGNRTGGQGT